MPGQRVGLKPHLPQPRQRIELRFAQRFRQLSPAVGKEPQRTGPGDFGVQLPQRAGGCVAGVGECLATAGLVAFVEGCEILVAHVDLAPHLKDCRGVGDFLRNIVDGAGVCGDIFAHRTVAAGCCVNKGAVLIAQRQ